MNLKESIFNQYSLTSVRANNFFGKSSLTFLKERMCFTKKLIAMILDGTDIKPDAPQSEVKAHARGCTKCCSLLLPS